MNYVNVNAATPWQLAVLLNISREEVEALLLARPFKDRPSFWAALPPGLAQGQPDLLLPKLNINMTTAGDLIRFTGIPTAVALRVTRARPFFMPRQLELSSGGEAYRELESIFTTPDVSYIDKTTGDETRLKADGSRVLISRSEGESIAGIVREVGLRRVFPGSRGPYEVYSLSEGEAAEDVLPALQEAYGRNVLPAFTDERSNYRYLNPKFCVVQFDEGVPAERQLELISGLGLEIEQRHRIDGLYTLRIEGSQTDPDALTRALRALNALREVRFAEPNFLGFDDADSSAEPWWDDGSGPGLPWNLLMTRVPEAWRAARGSSDVVIAVIDSGADETHPALSGSLVSRAPSDDWNFAADGDPSPDDEEGHGTFVTGLLVGNGWQGVWGICPGSRVLPLKISLSGEVNSYANRRAAILYALNHRPGRAPVIINLSWKTTGDVALIRDAIASAIGRGAIVAASAGNFPTRENEPHFPSDYPGVTCVAAVNSSRRRADYSFFAVRQSQVEQVRRHLLFGQVLLHGQAYRVGGHCDRDLLQAPAG